MLQLLVACAHRRILAGRPWPAIMAPINLGSPMEPANPQINEVKQLSARPKTLGQETKSHKIPTRSQYDPAGNSIDFYKRIKKGKGMRISTKKPRSRSMPLQNPSWMESRFHHQPGPHDTLRSHLTTGPQLLESMQWMLHTCINSTSRILAITSPSHAHVHTFASYSHIPFADLLRRPKRQHGHRQNHYHLQRQWCDVSRTKGHQLSNLHHDWGANHVHGLQCNFPKGQGIWFQTRLPWLAIWQPLFEYLHESSQIIPNIPQVAPHMSLPSKSDRRLVGHGGHESPLEAREPKSKKTHGRQIEIPCCQSQNTQHLNFAFFGVMSGFQVRNNWCNWSK